MYRSHVSLAPTNPTNLQTSGWWIEDRTLTSSRGSPPLFLHRPATSLDVAFVIVADAGRRGRLSQEDQRHTIALAISFLACGCGFYGLSLSECSGRDGFFWGLTEPRRREPILVIS